MSSRYRTKKDEAPSGARPLNLNQVVSYNLRAAREMQGWSQKELASRLEKAFGKRVTQSTVSSLERVWSGGRRREFDIHELAVFADVLDVPVMWFLLPPPGHRAELEGMNRSVPDLYILLLGRNDQVELIAERLREFGVYDPTPEDETLEKITGRPSHNRQKSYRERRKKLLLALLDAQADDLERAAHDLGSFFDHLRQVGIRGFIAENTNDADYSTLPEHRQPQGDSASVDEASGSGDETSAARPPRTRSGGALDTGEAGDASQDAWVSR